jgi:AcrR family transcriptional regulator
MEEYGLSENRRIPKQQRGKQTRSKILNAALELFSQKGFQRTSSLEIASRAGISVGCLYSYFKDKHEIFLEMMNGYNETFYQMLESQFSVAETENYDKKQWITNLINSIWQAHKVLGKFHNELIVMLYSDKEVARVMAGFYHKVICFFQEKLTQLESELRVANPETAAVIVYDIVDKLVDRIGTENEKAQEIIDETTDLLYRYLFLC